MAQSDTYSLQENTTSLTECLTKRLGFSNFDDNFEGKEIKLTGRVIHESPCLFRWLRGWFCWKYLSKSVHNKFCSDGVDVPVKILHDSLFWLMNFIEARQNKKRFECYCDVSVIITRQKFRAALNFAHLSLSPYAIMSRSLSHLKKHKTPKPLSLLLRLYLPALLNLLWFPSSSVQKHSESVTEFSTKILWISDGKCDLWLKFQPKRAHWESAHWRLFSNGIRRTFQQKYQMKFPSDTEIICLLSNTLIEELCLLS